MDIFDWVGSLFDDQERPGGNQGPVGSATNQRAIDPGTLSRRANRSRSLVLDPITIWAVNPAVTLKKGELKEFVKKFALGPEVYDGLGLAGQIAKKFLKVPYRNGKVVRKGVQYKVLDIKNKRTRVGGLVCSSFVNIFGAIWFAEDHTKPEPVQAMKHSVKAKVRRRLRGEDGKEWKIVTKRHGKEEVLGESNDEKKAEERARLRTAAAKGKYSLSSPQIYASEHDGSLVNIKRLRRNNLIATLNKERLYAVVSYHDSGTSTTKGHVWLLAYSTVANDWVTIQSTGWGRASGGKGAGPGIYRIPRVKNKKSPRYGLIKRGKWYQAFDWGPLKKSDPNFNDWNYVP